MDYTFLAVPSLALTSWPVGHHTRAVWELHNKQI